MRWSLIPYERLKAIDLGCRGFARALARCIQQGDEPTINVLRVAPENCTPNWYVEIRASGTHQQFAVDMARLETQAAVVPIYLVDHIQNVREELSEVFEINGFKEGVNRVFPSWQIHGGEMLS